MTVEWISKGEQLGVKTPYNPLFVDHLKAQVPSARWDHHRNIWMFDKISRADVERLANCYYPPEDQLQTIQITWQFDEPAIPAMDTMDMIVISKLVWSWRRNFPITFRPIETTNMFVVGNGVAGQLIIEAICRRGIELRPEPKEIKIIKSGRVDHRVELLELIKDFSQGQLKALHEQAREIAGLDLAIDVEAELVELKNRPRKIRDVF